MLFSVFVCFYQPTRVSLHLYLSFLHLSYMLVLSSISLKPYNSPCFSFSLLSLCFPPFPSVFISYSFAASMRSSSLSPRLPLLFPSVSLLSLPLLLSQDSFLTIDSSLSPSSFALFPFFIYSSTYSVSSGSIVLFTPFFCFVSARLRTSANAHRTQSQGSEQASL